MKECTQLNQSQRNQNEVMRNQQFTISHIAGPLNCDISRIRREIRRNVKIVKTPNNGSYINYCVRASEFRRRFICQHYDFYRQPCRLCSKCNAIRSDFVLAVFTRRLKASYVCNGCVTRFSCRTFHTK